MRVPLCVLGVLTLLMVPLGLGGCGSEGDDDAAGDDDATADDDDATADDDDATPDDDDVADDDDDDVADDDDAGDDDTSDDIDASTVVGLTYMLDIGNGGFTFTEPAGIGAVLGLFLGQLPEDQGIIFTAESIDQGAGTVDILIGSGLVSNPNDDPANWIWEQSNGSTTDADGTWINPSFGAGPADMVFDAGAGVVWLGDVLFGGTYAADGSQVNDSSLAGLMDTIPFDEMLGFDPGGLCATLGGLSIPCETCPPASPHQGDFCLYLVAEGGTCPLMAGLTMVPVP